MTHNELARSLADHLRGPERMVWCDLQLGPSGSPRPDVFAIYKSFVHPQPTAYECKVSREDFRGDVTSGKWQSYLRFASGVYFACEAGLLSKADVPEHCGLIVRNNQAGTWRAVKKPVLRPVEIPSSAWLKLLIDGVEREGPSARARRYAGALDANRMARRFGEVVAKTVADRMAVEDDIAAARSRAQRIVEDATREAARIRKEATDELEPLRRELCEVLGLEPSASSWQIKHAVEKVRALGREHPAVKDLDYLVGTLESVIDRYRHKVKKHMA